MDIKNNKNGEVFEPDDILGETVNSPSSKRKKKKKSKVHHSDNKETHDGNQIRSKGMVVSQKTFAVDSQEFFELCSKKEVDKVKHILFGMNREDAKQLVNCYHRFRPLHRAARYAYLPKSIELVKLLVDFGADVNGLDVDQQNALHHASTIDFMRKDQGGDLNVEPTIDNSVVHYLVSKGADVNHKDRTGYTPIAMAIMRSHHIVVRDLTRINSLELETPAPDGCTPIHYAAYFANGFAMNLLLGKGSNVVNQDANGRTAVHYLSWQEKGNELLKHILETTERQSRSKLDELLALRDIDKKTALHLAAEGKCVSAIKLLVEKGADIEAKGCFDDSTTLHVAAAAGDKTIVECLLDLGAKVEVTDKQGHTPLHTAAAHNHAHICQLLVERNKDLLKVRSNVNYSPVLVAASYGSSEALIMLLNMGSNVYDRSENKTLLRMAVDNGKDRTVEALLEFCAERNLLNLLIRKDNDENTPMHIAAKLGYIRCIRVMCELRFALQGLKSSWNNKKRQTPLHVGAMHGQVVIVKELLRVGYFDIDVEDEEGNSPIQIAAQHGHNNVVKTLIKSHAAIKAGDDLHLDLLHYAAERGWTDTCDIVLKNGADINKVQGGATPLQLAAQNGRRGCVRLFMRKNADLTIVNDNGENCLDLAVRFGHREVVKIMLESEHWDKFLHHSTIDKKSQYFNTPLRNLIKHMPDMANLALERCTERIGQADSENFQITYNYEFLDDLYTNYNDRSAKVYGPDNHVLSDAEPYTRKNGIMKRNHPLTLMVEHDCEVLLKSPLVASLLEHKWNTYGSYLYYLHLMVQVIFVVFLTIFVSVTDAPYSFFKESKANCTADSCSNIVNHCLSGDEERSPLMAASQYIVLVISFASIMIEIVQMITSEYFSVATSIQNAIQWILHVCAFLAVADFISPCVRENPFVREPWQWQLASVAILLAWLELMLAIRKVPRFGIFVVMFTDVLFTFLQFLPVFALLLIGFSLSFGMLFGNQERFDGTQYSIVATFIMMVGEMDFQDIFFNTGDAQSGTQEYAETVLYYKGTSYVLFIVFVTCMTIITMNLLVGLAVDDIKAVQEQAELKRLAMRAELALSVESLLPTRLRRRFIVKCCTFHPNKKKTRLERIRESINDFFVGKEKPSPISPQDEILQHIAHRVDSMAIKVDRLEGVEQMLIQIMRGQDKLRQITKEKEHNS